MDIASLIGLIGGIGMILGAMISGGGIAPFVDVPSILIVFGGTAFLVLYAVPMPVFRPFRCDGKSFYATN